ncbi:MAG: acyl carrier protein [Kiritimatiellae bacterium]|nr:acyl carrier protein [Kiritimatiellia bacterium]
MQKFLDKVAEVLEVPSVTPDFAFRSAPEWSSLTGFALLVMCEQEYGARIAPDDFLKLRTVGDLAAAAGVVG